MLLEKLLTRRFIEALLLARIALFLIIVIVCGQNLIQQGLSRGLGDGVVFGQPLAFGVVLTQEGIDVVEVDIALDRTCVVQTRLHREIDRANRFLAEFDEHYGSDAEHTLEEGDHHHGQEDGEDAYLESSGLLCLLVSQVVQNHGH